MPARSLKNFLPTVNTQHQAHLSVLPVYNSLLLYPFQPCHYLLWPLLCEASYKNSDVEVMELSLHVLLKHPSCPWIAATQEKVWSQGVVSALKNPTPWIRSLAKKLKQGAFGSQNESGGVQGSKGGKRGKTRACPWTAICTGCCLVVWVSKYVSHSQCAKLHI